MTPSPAALAAAEEIVNRIFYDRPVLESEKECISVSAAIIDRHMAHKHPKLESRIYEIAEQMELKGGKFVRALADCLLFADTENKGILISAFPHIMERYDSLAAIDKREPISKDILNPL